MNVTRNTWGQRGARWSVLCSLLLICLLAACSSNGATSSPTPTSAATPVQASPTVPKGTVLYQADWSKGMDGWKDTGGWKLEKGQMVYDSTSSDDARLISPYQPTTPHYAVEAVIQIVRGGNHFSLFADHGANSDGFQGYVFRLRQQTPFTGFAHVSTDSMDWATLQEIDYHAGPNWRSYRVEITGNQANFFIDDNAMSTATSTKVEAVSTGPLGIEAQTIAIRVKSFRVIAL